MFPRNVVRIQSKEKKKNYIGIMSKGQIGPPASPVGDPHTAPQGVTVHDAFPPFPPNKKNYIYLDNK